MHSRDGSLLLAADDRGAYASSRSRSRSAVRQFRKVEIVPKALSRTALVRRDFATPFGKSR